MKRFFRAFILLIGTVISVGLIIIGVWSDLKSVWEDLHTPIPLYGILVAFLVGGIAFHVYDLLISMQKEADPLPYQPKENEKPEDQETSSSLEWIKPRKSSIPEHIQYTRDEIEGILWKWKWYMLEHTKSGISVSDIYELKALCPKCMNELMIIQEVHDLASCLENPPQEIFDRFFDGEISKPVVGRVWLYCEREGCEFQEKKRVDADRIHGEIHRRVRTEDWKHAKERIQRIRV